MKVRIPRAKDVFGRLASHASRRRSGDLFCVYLCDRFVDSELEGNDLLALVVAQAELLAST